jgi:hypothetical protein
LPGKFGDDAATGERRNKPRTSKAASNAPKIRIFGRLKFGDESIARLSQHGTGTGRTPHNNHFVPCRRRDVAKPQSRYRLGFIFKT